MIFGLAVVGSFVMIKSFLASVTHADLQQSVQAFAPYHQKHTFHFLANHIPQSSIVV
tara:strand:- start:380 stop:550 length:171 start_codon:yes stop_codon:yes gene_type:complete